MLAALVFVWTTGMSAAFLVDKEEYPFENPNLDWDRRVDDFVGRMTIEELAGQLSAGAHTAPPIHRLGLAEYGWWTNCARGPKSKNATSFPQNIGIGAAFDVTLMRKVAEAASIETRAWYNHYVKHGPHAGSQKGLTCFSPNMDLFRDPRWGRAQETYSEDPYHAGQYGYNFIKGLHGSDKRYIRVADMTKHFAVSAGPDAGRTGFDAKFLDILFSYDAVYVISTCAGDRGLKQSSAPEKVHRLNFCEVCGVRLMSVLMLWKEGDSISVTLTVTLMRKVAEAASIETRAWYNHYVKHGPHAGSQKGLTCFSPNMDLFRDPRWGRAQETYSEDPYHAGQYGYNFIKGLHGSDKRYIRVADMTKHFAVSAGPDAGRTGFDAKPSERDFRTYFLPPFKKTVEAGAMGMCCAYNRINGVPACANDRLMNQILRKTWGFKGFVIADAGAIHSIMDAHHYTHDKVTTLVDALKAGCNLECEGKTDLRYYTQIPEAIKSGKLQESFVRDSMKPLIYTRMRLGMFDPDNMNPYSKLDINKDVLTHDHIQLALETAMKSIVLLKNDNFLPIKHKPHSIALVGPQGDEDEQIYGVKAPDTDRHLVKTVLEGLKQLSGHVTFKSGCSDTTCEHYNSHDVTTAIHGADVIFVALGSGQSTEHEGHDRKSIALPGHQDDLLRDVIHNNHDNKPIVLLILAGSPVDISAFVDNSHIKAILQCHLPAMSTGSAIYNVLTASGGSTSVPSGRLPYTWPVSDKQVPSMDDYTMSGRTYWYFKGDPLFPYGYGLSYTTFHYDNLRVSNSVQAGQSLSGSVDVNNVGSHDADEVVQVYLFWHNHHNPTPKLGLASFGRVTVPHGGEQTYHFTISPQSMAVWDDHKGWEIVAGSITLHVGGQQPNQKKSVGSNTLSASFDVHGSKTLGVY